MVEEKNLIEGQRILIVDDEPDVLEALEELLPMCDLTKAATFEEGKEYLETQEFDLAILDIMGVDGYGLLQIARAKGVIPIMLTAHALSPEHTAKSYKEGAASYIPKEEMANIQVLLNDILEAKERGKNFWWRWLERLGPFYERTFGPDWQKKDKDFWKKFTYI
ncbi:MAG: response regulator [Deltaproteobacteria bacterium]|nr:response regulator [Deltaproteobacteria bacterium]